ncbi:RNA polymerase sigma factor [Planctomicrobium sp. SH661]|uniref:RNA polymerase sigma factor n=1 Tax=Planctomicrobium sp. SH661 TaxID=3448124 RepID=UPI003F5AEBB2
MIVGGELELAQRCLRGDVRALREFVEVYREPVFALCLKMLRHREDAEDTAQESLVRALRYLKSWDPSQPLTPWVMKIAANRCRTNLGRRSRTPAASEVVEQLAAVTAENTGLGEELELALDVLVAHQRRCFCLFYEHELSIAEISEIMEVPEGTIKTWLHRSRKQLAQRLRERGVHPHQ